MKTSQRNRDPRPGRPSADEIKRTTKPAPKMPPDLTPEAVHRNERGKETDGHKEWRQE
jgi:hypothetical protein